MLTEAFYLTNDIEKYGTGFKRIYSLLKNYPNLHLDINYSNNFFKVDLSEKKNEPLNIRQKQIIKNIKSNNLITINELSQLCKVGRETIKRDIKKLKELKIIERIGSDKTGYWKVL